MSQVVLYGTRFCPFCIQARRLLTSKGIEFKDIPLDSDPELRSSVMDRSSRHTVPQIGLVKIIWVATPSSVNWMFRAG